MFVASVLAIACVAVAQNVGTVKTEIKPPLPIQDCTSVTCTTVQTSVTMDANWRWVHDSNGKNCFTGNLWDGCKTVEECSQCFLDGANYLGTHGVSSSGNEITLKFVTTDQYGTNIGSRVFLMTPDKTKYQMFKLLNREFTFDVDVSKLGCGLNGALYFVEMPENGGLNFGTNAAGSAYGTGYCDAQCPRDVKFINGEANSEDWLPSSKNKNAGAGKYGSCCSEMDVWEANSISAAYMPHTCTVPGLYRCSDPVECGDTASGHRYDGTCDKDGCDWNAYRMGDTAAYGPGKLIDTSSKFTVVTQFITSNGTDTGDLIEIRRYYKQNGKLYYNTHATIHDTLDPYNTIMDGSCDAQKALFGDYNHFKDKGGMKGHGDPLSRGMVLVLSLFDDYGDNMLWLDSTYPDTSPAVGAARGTCLNTSGKPADVESQQKDAQVIFSNIRFGKMGSTDSGIPVPISPQPCSQATTPTGATGLGTCGNVSAAGKCDLGCSTGYVSVPGVCNATGGTWIISPQCIHSPSPKCSQVAASVSVADVGNCASVDAGKNCTMNCKTGYSAVAGVCGAQGAFTTQPLCRSSSARTARCTMSIPASRASGLGTCAAVIAGGSCALACMTGYIPVAGQCSINGTLWATSPDCIVPASCFLITDGVVGFSSSGTCQTAEPSGETCSLDCAVGYISAQGSCYNGVWTNTPTCTLSSKSGEVQALCDLYTYTGLRNVWPNPCKWTDPCQGMLDLWSSVCTNGALVRLYLDSSKYDTPLSVGTIPSTIGNLINLQDLFLGIPLSGTIPSTIGNLVNLQELSLWGTQMSGTIPGAIGNLINLKRLDIVCYQLSGTIPSTIGNLSKLQHLRIFNNQLVGTIPSAIFSLRYLFELDLSGNQLSGTIPSTIENLVNLQYLRLDYNQLSGTIPSTIGNISLDCLCLSGNKLTGTIPSSVARSVSELRLNNNQLDGTIPSTFVFGNFFVLDLSYNKLRGTIPSTIGNLDQLDFLDLSYNRLSGTIPREMCSMSPGSGNVCSGNSDNICIDPRIGGCGAAVFASCRKCCLLSLPATASGWGTCFDTVGSGDSCYLSCQQGYHPLNASCLFASWSPSEPTCTADPCSLPELPTTASGWGTCVAGVISSGSSCTLECSSGYSASDGLCSFGSWTRLPVCKLQEGTDKSLGMITGIAAGIVGGCAACICVAVALKRANERRVQCRQYRTWHFDERMYGKAAKANEPKIFRKTKPSDLMRVVEAYQRCPCSHYDIGHVETIYAASVESTFETRADMLEARHGNPAFDPGWGNDPKSGQRTQIIDRLNSISAPNTDSHYPHVGLMMTWHGTKPELLSSLMTSGYASLATTDIGFFGKGIYSTTEAKYAYNVYFKGALIVNWVSFYSAFPVVDGDMEFLEGKSAYSNYDAHFVPVCPESLDDSETNFYPCKDLAEATYHEMVVFEASQCVPRYLVTLQPVVLDTYVVPCVNLQKRQVLATAPVDGKVRKPIRSLRSSSTTIPEIEMVARGTPPTYKQACAIACDGTETAVVKELPISGNGFVPRGNSVSVNDENADRHQERHHGKKHAPHSHHSHNDVFF